MRRVWIGIVSLLLLAVSTADAQDYKSWRNQYEQYKEQKQQQYEDFKAKANAEFSEYLKKRWKEYQPQQAIASPIPDVLPKPQRLPVENHQPEPLPAPESALNAIRALAEPPSGREISTPRPVGVGEKWLELDFFGDALRIPWTSQLTPRLTTVDEQGFASLWSQWSTCCDSAISYLESYAQQHALNGWGYYQLVRRVSERVYPAQCPNEQVAMQVFLISQLKFKAQVAMCGHKLVALLPFQEKIYGVPFLTIGTQRYYIFGDEVDYKADIRTYDQHFTYANRLLSLQMDGSMRVGDVKEMEQPRLSQLLGEPLRFPIGVGNIALMYTCPMTESEVYYRQGVYPPLAKRILEVLRRKCSGMNDYSKVGFLLNLVQNGFDYALDEDLFGRQKQLFIEESFFYGKNNCKDRVGVFSWLVRELTGLDVLFVRYEGNAASQGVNHIACAVAFETPVDGDAFEFKGRRYVVCDPTYINAGIGRTMPCYANAKWEIEYYN